MLGRCGGNLMIGIAETHREGGDPRVELQTLIVQPIRQVLARWGTTLACFHANARFLKRFPHACRGDRLVRRRVCVL